MNERLAEPALPRPSVACTTIVCAPGARLLYFAGLAQARERAAVELAGHVPASLTLNGTEALVPEIDGVPIVTFGAVVSTTNVLVAQPSLPTASLAVTLIVWLPSDSPAYAFGLVQAAAAPSSSEHCSAPVAAGGGERRPWRWRR